MDSTQGLGDVVAHWGRHDGPVPGHRAENVTGRGPAAGGHNERQHQQLAQRREAMCATEPAGPNQLRQLDGSRGRNHSGRHLSSGWRRDDWSKAEYGCLMCPMVNCRHRGRGSSHRGRTPGRDAAHQDGARRLVGWVGRPAGHQQYRQRRSIPVVLLRGFHYHLPKLGQGSLTRFSEHGRCEPPRQVRGSPGSGRSMSRPRRRAWRGFAVDPFVVSALLTSIFRQVTTTGQPAGTSCWEDVLPREVRAGPRGDLVFHLQHPGPAAQLDELLPLVVGLALLAAGVDVVHRHPPTQTGLADPRSLATFATEVSARRARSTARRRNSGGLAAGVLSETIIASGQVSGEAGPTPGSPADHVPTCKIANPQHHRPLAWITVAVRSCS